MALLPSRNVKIISKILDLHVYECVCSHQNLLVIYHSTSLKKTCKNPANIFLSEEKL